MATQWAEWLSELKAAGKGGVRLKGIDRGLPYSLAFSIPLNVTGDSFDASLRLSPDASGSTLVDFTIAIGTYSAGATLVTLSLTQVQTAALPADGDLDGVEEFVFDLLRTPSGGTQARLIGGVIPILGKVSNYG